jgi:hypothetical protein
MTTTGRSVRGWVPTIAGHPAAEQASRLAVFPLLSEGRRWRRRAMKNPFNAFHTPIDSEPKVEGLPIASGAVSAGSAFPSGGGEQTEILTRLRRKNRGSRVVDSSGSPSVAPCVAGRRLRDER